MALSADSAIVGATTSRLLNKLAYDVANKATDVTTAATGDVLLGVDISADYEIKYFDAANLAEIMGTTQADQTKLNAITATAAEINYLDIATLGTGAASKAVVLDTGDDYTWPATGILTYGVLKDPAGTTLGATAAELNMAADQSANYEIVTGGNVVTASESGKTFILNSTTAFATTLPAKAAGLRFDFWCGPLEVTGGNHTIIVNAADDDTFFGSINCAGAVVVCDTKATITLVADKFTAGDRVTVFNDGTNWYVDGNIAIAAGCTFDT